MMQTSVDLKDQCKIQEEECKVLDLEQQRVKEDMNQLRKRVDALQREKQIMEGKLQELRLENDQLESFLSSVINFISNCLLAT